MRRVQVRFFSLALLLACSACSLSCARKHLLDQCEGQADQDPGLGAPSEYPLTSESNIGTVAVRSPLDCSSNQGHVRLERLQGRRTLGTSGGEAGGCLELPKQAQDFSECPVIAASVILHEVFSQLRARAVVVNGIGPSPCLKDAGRQEISELTAGVAHWKDLHEAVKLVAQLLETYDIRGTLGVAVRGLYCLKDKTSLPGHVQEDLKVCRSSTSSSKSKAEEADKNFSPSLADLSPGTATVRLQYAASPTAKPILIETLVSNAMISPTLPDRAGLWDWSLQVDVSVPEIPNPVGFFIAFPRFDTNQEVLEPGDFSTIYSGIDIPRMEHGDSCKMAGASQPSVVHLVEANAILASGYWRGNVLFEPAFYAKDAKPTGEQFILESLVFNRIETREGFSVEATD